MSISDSQFKAEVELRLSYQKRYFELLRKYEMCRDLAVGSVLSIKASDISRKRAIDAIYKAFDETSDDLVNR